MPKFDKEKCFLPDFLMIGAAKSGTTSLAKYLMQHPQIYIPEVKELHFFLFAGNPPSYYENHILGPVLIYDLEKYASYYKNATEDKICGDCSVTYMYSKGYKKVIRNIKNFYPNNKIKNLKFIAILRNPIDRAFSQYVTRLYNREDRSFVEACFKWKEREKLGWSIAYDYLGFSFYYEPLKAYISEFGRENVRIYLYEDLKERPAKLLKELFKFLELDSSFVPPNLNKRYNISGIPKSKIHNLLYKIAIKHNPAKYPLKLILPKNLKEKLKDKIREFFMQKPKLTEEEREKLKPIFKEDILKLQDLIGRDLSHWLES